MILIYPEKLSSVTADTEDTEYLASNLENTKIRQVWKSTGSNVGTLTATVAAGANQLALYGTNAVTAAVTVKIGAVTQETQSFSLTSGSRTFSRFWCSYTAINEVHTISIVLTAAVGSVIEAGAIKIGVGIESNNPEYGLSEGRKDFSIIKELNNGAFYIRRRIPVRTFTVTFLATRGSEFYTFTDAYDTIGPQAMAWLLAEDINDYQWAVLGHMIDPFKGSHAYYSHSKVSFSITEAV
jgi:hypothetical protein